MVREVGGLGIVVGEVLCVGTRHVCRRASSRPRTLRHVRSSFLASCWSN